MNHLEILTQNLQETDDLGRRLANYAFPGLVVCLTGNLGAGKTRFSKAICTALGVSEEEVNSPTFVLIQEYVGRWPERHGSQQMTIYHFDTYRLKDLDEFCELGAEEMLSSDGICLLEWGERVAEMLPTDTLYITIEATSETSRQFTFRSEGKRVSKLIQELKTK